MGKFAGIDWGEFKHAACVIDETGKIVATFEVEHDAAGLSELRKRLTDLSKGDTLQVAIERPTGLLIDTLIDGGFRLFAIHPNKVKACRPRYSAACAKDDRGDSYIIADLLRTDGHRFSALEPLSDEIQGLRALVRTRDDLVVARVALCNQLVALLSSFWPGATKVFCEIHSRVALAFIKTFPTPTSASKLTKRQLEAFLKKHSYPGRSKPSELLERLRSAPIGKCGESTVLAKSKASLALVGAIEPLVEQIAAVSRDIERRVASLPAGRIIMSFPRSGKICAAQILAEIGDVRSHFATPERLCIEAGVVPVTRASGKLRKVVFRYACNHRLRRAVTTFADNSRHASPWAAQIYKRARGRGCDHPHAVRILGRAWLRIMWTALVNGTPYDLARHKAAANLGTAA
jgi:transposase